jgi:hypothetical protein
VRLIGRFHLIWVFIALLGAYVLFLTFVADVGGSDDAIPMPTATHATVAPAN